MDRKKDMDILDDMGVSKLSAKVFFLKKSALLLEANRFFTFLPENQLLLVFVFCKMYNVVHSNVLLLLRTVM